ncbi:MAG: glycerol-3-phosphate 1-O-acyltransferase PlsY [Puniceicoccales bacterium]|jgi:glycerol-3-phosphate acyltransferase PlsY|nr:glycerol-3-phosphate 1-O-acyltransferase PlsY [Puniceicoccales bacterium]
MLYFWIFLVGYFLGSIPSGVIVAKAKGIDILNEGSGNMGATNVRRILGKKYGVFVFFLDFFKSALPIFVAKMYLRSHSNLANSVGALLLLSLLLGNCFSIFLKFRGGKGVATVIGGSIVLMPCATLLGVVLWYSVFLATRFVSIASLCFALSLPFNAYLFAYQREIFRLTFFLTAVIFVRHAANIRRLWNGEEQQFGEKKH